MSGSPSDVKLRALDVVVELLDVVAALVLVFGDWDSCLLVLWLVSE
jgi:hypothetical protein